MRKFIFLCALIGATASWADSEVQSEVVDGVTWYYRTWNNSYWDSTTQRSVYETNATVVAGADKYTGDLVMPSQLGGFPVKRVESAFRVCSALKSVVVPEGVTYLGYAFYGCTTLTNVTLPSSLTSIGSSSFENCTSLKDVVIPDNVTDCGSYAFRGCTSLTNVILSASLKNISSYMFYGCSSLKNVIIPESVTSIGECAFYGCTSLTKFNVPASVMSLGNDFLRGCSSLTKLTVSKDNPNYKSVDNCIVSASGTTLIAVPYGCVEVVIPDGVSAIPESMFREDYALTKVTIPSNVTSIGDCAFGYCSALTSVTIPEGVTSIVDYAFYCCSALTSVTIPVGVTSIGDCAFSCCYALTSVTIPSSATSIGYEAFYCCSALTCVTIPEGVTNFGGYAFSGCSALTSVTIPEGVTSIGYEAFYYCSALTSVTIPSSVTSIGNGAFESCSKLSSVTFRGQPPSGVENSCLLSKQNVSFPRSSGGAWLKLLNDVNKFQGYNRKQPAVAVLSSKIRENDPTILDVVYKVTSSVTNTVKVRALAFEEGVRSFANVVRPITFIADTNGVETVGNVGDAVAANVEHTLSWKVSADWSNQLAKVTFEVLATEGDLLPLEVRTIPASDQYGKMDVTWNSITESQWFDALLWLYADCDSGIVIEDGVVKRVADGYLMTYDNATISTLSGRSRQYVNGVRAYYDFASVPEYVMGKMGYTLLSGEVLNYVNEETRLGLSPSGARQYGYRIVDE